MSFSISDGEDRSLGEWMVKKWGHLPYNTLQEAATKADEIFWSSQWKAGPGQFMKSRIDQVAATNQKDQEKEKEKETDVQTVLQSVLMQAMFNRMDASDAKYKRSEFVKTLNLSFRGENLVPFLMSQYDHLPSQELKLICDYTTKIFNSATFQTQPRQFMEIWVRKRGNTEEFRVPEDPSIKMVQYVMKKYKL